MSHKFDLIKKYAQAIPTRTSPKKTPSSDSADESGTKIPPRGAPVSSGVKSHIASVPTVKEMQVAIQNLAKNVIIDSESATMSSKPQDAAPTSATQPIKTSKKSFNDFIAEQYLGGLDQDKKGVEWTKDTQIIDVPGKQRTQTDIYELDVVMDTLRRIGTSAKEFVADGRWGSRTDNALRNIMGFAYALLQLEGDFALNNDIYTFDNWKEFNKNLSGYKIEKGLISLSSAEQVKRATEIIKHLKAITKLYNHFRQQVLAKPEFIPTITGERGFVRYDAKGSNKDFLTAPEEQMAKSDAPQIPVKYTAPRLSGKVLDYIPLKALRNKEEYIKWMSNYAGNTEDAAIDIFNKVIKPKIESM